jgi:hypothetical protein
MSDGMKANLVEEADCSVQFRCEANNKQSGCATQPNCLLFPTSFSGAEMNTAATPSRILLRQG